MKSIMLYLMVTLSGTMLVAPTHAQDDGDKQKTTATFKGVIAVAKDYNISPEINNKIKRIHFISGQLVKKGDLLVEFDTEEKELEVAYAQASYERAQAHHKLEQDRLRRSEKLKTQSVVSLSKYRELQLNVEIAVANEKLAKITLEKAKLVLSEQKLYAPFDGQMSASRYSENTNLEVGESSEIAKIVQLDPIYVRYSMTYSYLARRLRENGARADIFERENVKLRLKFPDGSYYGTFGKFVAAAFDLDAETGELSAIAVFPNPELQLVPGLQVSLDAIEQ